MKKYNPELPTLIFDLDGTIVDNFHENLEIIFNYHKNKIQNKIQTLEEFYNGIRNNTLRDFFKKYKLNPFMFLFDKLILRNKIIKSGNNIKLFLGMKNFLEEMKNDYNLFILSSTYNKYIKNTLETFELDDTFVNFNSVGLFNKSKKIEKLMKKYNINKKECIYVGDEIRDYIACLDAEIKCINMTYGYNAKIILEKYNNVTCNNVNELKLKVEMIFNE